MFSPEAKIAKSKGIDRPMMKVYLAGYMAGDVDKECKQWRKQIREHYLNWDEDGAYPICFLDPYNGPESNSIHPKGLISNIPANAIRDGDKLSVKHADLLIVNIDNFGQTRASWGTPTEMAWALDKYDHPVICIVPKHLGDMSDHPFIGRASWIVESVDELLNKGCLEYFYKRMAGAIY